MAEIKKKEIRVTFNLNNKDEKELYEKLKEYPQPGKIIKSVMMKNIKDENNTNDGINNELLKVLSKLSDKIDTLTISQTKNESIVDDTSNEILFTAEVSSDDLDDIDF